MASACCTAMKPCAPPGRSSAGLLPDRARCQRGASKKLSAGFIDTLSNTPTTEFCVEALEAALTRYGTPEIFNADQGAQFTSTAFTAVLNTVGVTISMDGKGR
jgi:transposase InsO family protein